MAAPTLQAEGTLNSVTSGNLTLTLPAHAADDILVCTVLCWLPNTVGAINTIPAPAGGWAKPASVQFPATPDGEIAFFWLRAASGSETNPTFNRALDWDSGTDGIYGGRAYVIRGCVKSGNPWDEIDPTVALTAANGAVDAVTVSGSERTVIQFLSRTDDYGTAPTLSGWTAGTAVEDTTGTDCSFRTFRKENVSSDTSADTSANEAPAAGAYVFFGVSFKPPAATDLVVQDATQAQSTDGIALTQVHVLTVADATQAQSTDAIALTQVHNLVVQDATQAHTVDNIALVVDLAVQDATQAQAADNLTLTQVHVLVVADAAQAHSVDNLALTQVHELVVQDATQAQTVDNLDLTQVHALVVADATQAQTADNVVLDAGASTNLVVQDSTQAHAVDNLALTQVHNLTVNDSTQAQSVDNIDLTQTHQLAVQDAAQAHTVDSLTLTQVHELVVADALQTQTVDNIVIDATGAITLTVQDATHAQAVDGLTLTYIRVPHVLAAGEDMADLDASETGQDDLDGSTSDTSALDATPTQTVLVATGG